MAINWSVRELDVFLALADTLSYSRAAERVHLTQPAVSGVITRLEEGLDARLFDRSTRSVRLTAAGVVLLPHVKLLRNQMDVAAHAVHDVVEMRSGHVRIAVVPSLALTAVPAALARFARLHPDVDFDVRDVLSGPALDLVREGEVDFALTASDAGHADLDFALLGSDRFVLLVPADHPLADESGALHWIDTVMLNHVSLPVTTSMRQYVDAALMQSGHRFQPKYEVEHIPTLIAMVSAGLCVAALPGLAARGLASSRVVERMLTCPDLHRPLGLVTRHGRRLSPAAAALAAIVKDELQRLTVIASPRRAASAIGACG